ncbi:MAG: methylmalonyl-CoA epimerase [Deltaproteobacteria bacterium]|nr:methylmalonyl-CoA epimerase [Deltaproteobacteria bacterium]
MKINKIAHIAIAVRDLETQVAFYRDVLGLELAGREVVADQQVKVAMFRVGSSMIELLEPTSEQSPIAKYLERRGEGIHHIAYDVDDVAAVLRELADKQVRLIDDAPRDGAHGAKIAFVHPRSTFGVLSEFCSGTHR